MSKFLTTLFFGSLFLGCFDNSLDKKGFQVNEIAEDENGQKVIGLEIDSLKIETRPRNVLLTFNPEHRLIPLYKVNYDKKTKEIFTGSNEFHASWSDKYEKGNNWNNHLIPGFEAIYGYNLLNVSHYNNQTKTENKLFEKPVLIKTLYYPSFTKDTLNYQPVKRIFYMVSAYDEDTNKDGFINLKDLRRLYFFDINGQNKKALIPKMYSVMSSEYDSANDLMYVFVRLDKNNNGQMDAEEPIEVFWIDLKNPENVGQQYKTQ